MRTITPFDVILQTAEGDRTMKGTIIRLLRDWYEQVFHAQEAPIRPILARDIEARRKLQATHAPEKFVELVTNIA
jgi:hypothetical protein